MENAWHLADCKEFAFQHQNPMVGCGKARNFKSSPPRRQERQEERSDPDI